jgi:6-phosphogluconolactonase
LLFSVLSDKYNDIIDWSRVNIFWVDERCVPPEDPESNYGMTKRILLDKTGIPDSNVFRMRGEADPAKEAERYSDLVAGHTRKRNGLPFFDIVLLGMGDDGHTASIFPGNEHLLHSNRVCETAMHPVTHQRRITLTAKVINNSGTVFFIVTGEKKAHLVEMIYRHNEDSKNLPAAQIRSTGGSTLWLLDDEAGRFIH